MRAAGGGEVQVTTSRQEDWNPSWGPDGQSLVWDEQLNPDSVLWTARRRSDGSWERPRLVAPGLKSASLPRVSPDGHWIAFTASDGMQLLEVATGQVRTVSPVVSWPWPSWSGDGRTLYFTTVLDSTGHFTIKGALVPGGTARTFVYGNDPVNQAYRYGLAVHDGRFYLPLFERKSDVWVAEIREE
jgi:Tol biopolymer transport system component